MLRVVLTVLLLCQLVACQSRTDAPPEVAAAPPVPLTATPDSTGDYIYRVGDFLFRGVPHMKVDFIDHRRPMPRRVSEGDTLFHDADYTILGSFRELLGMGVYRRYQPTVTFEQLQAGPRYRGRLAAPDFRSDSNAVHYRSRITEVCRRTGVNFAGRYTVVDWGCGTECLQVAIVDRQTGKIYFTGLFGEQEEGFYGFAYRPDSRLLILNSYLLDDYPGYYLCRPGQLPLAREWRDGRLQEPALTAAVPAAQP